MVSNGSPSVETKSRSPLNKETKEMFVDEMISPIWPLKEKKIIQGDVDGILQSLCDKPH